MGIKQTGTGETVRILSALTGWLAKISPLPGSTRRRLVGISQYPAPLLLWPDYPTTQQTMYVEVEKSVLSSADLEPQFPARHGAIYRAGPSIYVRLYLSYHASPPAHRPRTNLLPCSPLKHCGGRIPTAWCTMHLDIATIRSIAAV